MTTYFMTNSHQSGDYPFKITFTDERGAVIYTAESMNSYEEAAAHGKSQIRTQAGFNSLFDAIMYGDAPNQVKFLQLEVA